MKVHQKDSLTMIVVATCLFALTAYGNSKSTKNENTNISEKEMITTTNENTDPVSFKNEDGESISTMDLKGKVVFINFWATWCPPCIKELPSINDLKKQYERNKNIVFLMVDVDADLEKSVSFMKDNKYDLTVYMPETPIPPTFLGNSIPTTVILGKDGKIKERIEGGRDYAAPDIKVLLDDLIGE
ncbi:TlpA family protein disulfide reductase [Sphingobacterium athyrii]|uniref:Thioredoxin n=1 Tax=Sphingobacterium athyrii TaxID=2152717 RepID=A0A363NUZ0_9SPHI|nr:TlpA disulfide reductase family protein [Sphingobacterium athyrii]PUV24599.1 thioredoxin [Sphingobacterium athyrii]